MHQIPNLRNRVADWIIDIPLDFLLRPDYGDPAPVYEIILVVETSPDSTANPCAVRLQINYAYSLIDATQSKKVPSNNAAFVPYILDLTNIPSMG